MSFLVSLPAGKTLPAPGGLEGSPSPAAPPAAPRNKAAAAALPGSPGNSAEPVPRTDPGSTPGSPLLPVRLHCLLGRESLRQEDLLKRLPGVSPPLVMQPGLIL